MKSGIIRRGNSHELSGWKGYNNSASYSSSSSVQHGLQVAIACVGRSFHDVSVGEWAGTLYAGGSFHNISVGEDAGTLHVGGSFHDLSVSEDALEFPMMLFTSQ